MKRNTPQLSVPGTKELRQFGIVMGVTIILLFGIILPIVFTNKSPYLIWVISLILIILSWLAPSSLRSLYSTWMKFGLMMNKITTPILLGIVFYLIITPMGIIMNIMGKEILQLKADKNKKTYRRKSVLRKKDSLERPF